MTKNSQRTGRLTSSEGDLNAGSFRLGEVIPECLGHGRRQKRELRALLDDCDGGSKGEYRARSPSNSERLNRALVELGLSAFKIHALIWQWRGAPAKGTLPYFTIHSLAKFCGLTRPTVRVALSELVSKGWIQRLAYNKHYKNALYRLVAIRQVQKPPGGAPVARDAQTQYDEMPARDVHGVRESRACCGTSAGGEPPRIPPEPPLNLGG